MLGWGGRILTPLNNIQQPTNVSNTSVCVCVCMMVFGTWWGKYSFVVAAFRRYCDDEHDQQQQDNHARYYDSLCNWRVAISILCVYVLSLVRYCVAWWAFYFFFVQRGRKGRNNDKQTTPQRCLGSRYIGENNQLDQACMLFYSEISLQTAGGGYGIPDG